VQHDYTISKCDPEGLDEDTQA